jgi:hypothetical protein
MSTKTRSDNSGNEEVVDIAKGGDESRGRKCHAHDVIHSPKQDNGYAYGGCQGQLGSGGVGLERQGVHTSIPT